METGDEGGMTAPHQDDAVWATLVRFSRTPLALDDAAALEQWLADDPMRRDMVRAVQRIAAMARHRTTPGRSVEAWSRVSARIAAGEPARGARRSRIAGRTIARGRVLVVAAALAAGLAAAVVQRRWLERSVAEWLEQRQAPHQVATRVGQRATVHLADGTTVVLGPESRLRYRSLVGTPRRTVQLDGEAYFEVAADTAHPFRVLASYATVQVVGTAFDVRAYPGDSVVQVVTAHGRVALRSRAARERGGALVERGQRGTVDTSGYVRVVSGVDLERDLGWTEGRLSYQLVPLGALLRDMERWYDVRFTLADPSLARVRVTIAFDGGSAGDVAAQLADLLQVPVARHGRTIRLGAR